MAGATTRAKRFGRVFLSDRRSPRRIVHGRRGRLVGLAIMASAAMALAGCTASGPDTTATHTGASSASPLKYTVCCAPGPTVSYNPWSTNAATISDFVYLRLAVQKYPSLTDYAPQLAASWSASGGSLTVNLQKQAKWQDGTRVTSKDLYDTVLLNGLNGSSVWNDITGLKIVNEKTVAFQLRPGQPVALAENDILANTIVYPSSVYGSFVTPQLEKDVPAYYAVYDSDPAKAVTMPEYARNNATFKQLAAVNPSRMMGDGPFKLEGTNGPQSKLVKWDGFWLADKIRVPGITLTHASNAEIYPQLLSGNVDYSNATMPPNVLQRWKTTPGAKLATPQANGFVIGFNNALYPLNLTAVRQAIAYALPRKTMVEAAYGTGSGAGGVWQQYMTGLTPQQNETFLTKKQLSSLNPYALNTAKASKLLTGAGFTQRGGQWYTPKGQQFTLSFEVQSDTSDIVTSFTSAAKALTAFGIKSDVNATSGAQMTADEQNGNFQVAAFFPNGVTPLQTLSAMLHDNNFQTSGNYAGKRGIGFGPTADAPGQGNVDVATTIYGQSRNVGPGSKMNELTWSWAQLVNRDVPYLWYATKVRQISFSTSHYTNWPEVGSDGTSAMWNLIGNNQQAGVVYAMENGYILPG